MHKLSGRVELIRPGDGQKLRDSSRTVNLTDIEQMKVGGREGRKFSAILGLMKNKRAPVVVKELSIYETFRVRKVIRSFIALKKKNYPVPDILRYFFDEKIDPDHIFLVMSDMRKNKDYYIWGFSDLMSKDQQNTLKKMNLSMSEVHHIIDLIQNLARSAAKDELSFEAHYYHIRKHKKTGMIDICLLDLDSDIWGQFLEGDELEDHNLDAVDSFIRFLLKQRKNA